MIQSYTLGSTGIVTPQNAFGALPIQRLSTDDAVRLVRRAYEGGMTYFDTARAYSDSEEKLGIAFEDVRDKIYIATKTGATTPDGFWRDLETSLKNLRTDYVDVHQFHNAEQCYAPGDGTGMYECMEEAKRQGMVRHIGVTAHKIQVAFKLAESGLYEVLQFPFSYLTGEKEIKLVQTCAERNVGFVVMKGLAGGLITNSRAAMAFILQYPVLPIWGVQRESELDEWLEYMENPPVMDSGIEEFIAGERKELSGEFCRGCGYCMPCPMDIQINQCARMSLMLRRAPSQAWLTDKWQEEMAKIDDCIDCRACETKCPYGLKIPTLLRKNLKDYRNVLSGKTVV